MLKHKKIATLNCAHIRLLSFFLYLISIHILLVVHTFLSPDFNSAPLLLLLILVARTSLSINFISAPFFYSTHSGGPYLYFARFHQCSVFSLTHCGGPYLPFALFQRLLPFSCLDIQISIYLNSHELALIMRIVNLSCAMESPPVYCKIPISI